MSTSIPLLVALSLIGAQSATADVTSSPSPTETMASVADDAQTTPGPVIEDPPTPSPTPTADSSSDPIPEASKSPATEMLAADVALSPIEEKYQALGGETGPLGGKIGAETTLADGLFQEYGNGFITWSSDLGAHVVEGESVPGIRALGIENLGLMTADGVSVGDGVTRSAWQNGWLVHSSRGTYLIRSQFVGRYASLGAESGAMGVPIAPPKALGEGWYQRFAGGYLTWSESSGTKRLTGRIANDWETSRLGPSRTGLLEYDSRTLDGGLSHASFSKGYVVSTSTYGSVLVTGAIETKYRAKGGAESYLGVPVSAARGGRDGASIVQAFSNGMIVWSRATGAHAITAQNYRKWIAQGGTTGVLGLPISDTYKKLDGKGTTFEHGLIYYKAIHHGANAVMVWGAMWGKYKARGGLSGDLSIPLRDRTQSGSLVQQHFKNAAMEFTKSGSTASRWKVRVKALPKVYSVSSADVKYTYHAGCPVGASSLRKVTLNYLGYDNRVHRGELIVRSDAVSAVKAAFTSGAWGAFPIEKMKNPNVWYGDDPDQMYANNTSAFNCRKVVGNPYAMSPHSYGRAVDINPRQNPYDDGSRWWPSNGTYWISHRTGEGVLTGGDPMTKGMTGNGFFWGGWWSNKDYQHFQK